MMLINLITLAVMIRSAVSQSNIYQLNHGYHDAPRPRTTEVTWYPPIQPTPSIISPVDEVWGIPRFPPIKTPEWTERDPNMPPLTGILTKRMCFLRKYRHLRACYFAFNPSQIPPSHESYNEKFLCKELQKRRQEQAGRPDQAVATPFMAPVTHRSLRSSNQNNPCSSFETEHYTNILEAEIEDDGTPAELYFNISLKLFQKFYVRNCKTSPLNNYSCKDVKIAVDTGVYIDDGDGNKWNDEVKVRKVLIKMDCALHSITGG